MSVSKEDPDYNHLSDQFISYLEKMNLDHIHPTPSDIVDDKVEEYEGIIRKNIDKDKFIRYVQSKKVSTLHKPTQPINILRSEDNEKWIPPNYQWKYFKRYKRYIISEEKFGKKSNEIMDTIDATTNEILNSLDNPKTFAVDQVSDRRGLVVGYVQSGKTANFVGLINKALDTGYGIIIVLTGVMENLRRQTQKRIERGVTGYSTKKQESTGVRKLTDMNHRILNAETITTQHSDFGADARKSFGGNFQNPKIFVSKKNNRVLAEIIGLFNDVSNGGTKQLPPLLLIDDEADYASLNKSNDPDELKTINSYIRVLLNLFQNRAYVGFTATPFANIFTHYVDDQMANIPVTIDDNRYTVGFDLYPKDFVLPLPKSPEYIGPEEVFGIQIDDFGDREEDDFLPLIYVIDEVSEDWENYYPLKHKKNSRTGIFRTGSLPYTLKRAIRTFILSVVAKHKRDIDQTHASMLIHVSRYTNWQQETRDLVQKFLDNIKSGLNDDARREGILQKLKSTYLNEFSDEKFNRIQNNLNYEDEKMEYYSWEDIRTGLDVISEINVLMINSLSEDQLLYENDHTYLIAIGGDALSRGITLEGLTVSYFVRLTRYYDSLMQMGRWFGYRKGYVDLCRLFVPGEFVEYYQHITRATVDLREQFHTTFQRNISPVDFKFRVLNHNGVLRITGGSLSRHTTTRASFSDQTVETYQFKVSDYKSNEEDYMRFQDIISNYTLRMTENDNFEIKDGDHETVLSIIDSQKNVKNIDGVVREYLKNYITEQVEANYLINWKIVIRSPAKKNKGELKDSTGKIFSIGLTQRKDVSESSSLYSINKARIADQNDEMLDFDKATKERVISTFKDEKRREMEESGKSENEIKERLENIDKPPGRSIRPARPPENGLMIIYLIDPELSEIKRYQGEKPLVGWAISFPKNKYAETEEYVVRRNN